MDINALFQKYIGSSNICVNNGDKVRVDIFKYKRLNWFLWKFEHHCSGSW